ncbi:hypothetical protein CA13_28000 [Planctomycetes bacterium CA13]|uniref:UPF0056 membrane protein n=1 Tax=Novipirellula herctigrandis TaxID=2527986 RepID=A0A5C5Z1U6_9BACT|nr:hypothetical protein CA13_28000 [Planctomycetes bacterium CA13]
MSQRRSVNMENELIKFVAAIFVITNPLGAIPLFLSLTKDHSTRERRRAARLASITVAVVLSANIVFGELILRFFGISIPAFQVGGGILILLLAISMLQARQSSMQHTPEEAEEAADKDSIGVVPMGIPLLAGPGAISTAIIFAHRNDGWFDHLSMIGVCLVLALCVWSALRLAERIGQRLGRTGINIGTRLMGLILAAVAVQFIFDGARTLWNTPSSTSPTSEIGEQVPGNPIALPVPNIVTDAP